MNEMNEADVNTGAPKQEPRWRPLSAIERRVVGVLVEKAKTVPTAYPMTLNAITTACNQKSNRFPTMELEAEQVEEALDSLREYGAVGLVQSSGRVEKYRHYLYDWLGVDKIELAVMAELLLRGAQTEGDLRARAARMEPIRDLGELRPVLASLKAKGLVLSLTPEGRGHVVTHALYLPRELERLRAEYGPPSARSATWVDASTGGAGEGARGTSIPAPDLSGGAVARGAVSGVEHEPSPSPRDSAGAPRSMETVLIETLRLQIDELRVLVEQMRGDVEQLVAEQRRMDDDLREVRQNLGL